MVKKIGDKHASQILTSERHILVLVIPHQTSYSPIIKISKQQLQFDDPETLFHFNFST